MRPRALVYSPYKVWDSTWYTDLRHWKIELHDKGRHLGFRVSI